MGTVDLAKVVAYETDEGEFVHPRCYFAASREIGSKWRNFGDRVMERLHTQWPNSEHCVICGGDSKIID
jgi:hypothetical protein